MSIQDEYRAKQNQLLEDITSDYESSIQARINDAKGTEEILFKLIEGKNNNIELSLSLVVVSRELIGVLNYK